MTNRETVTPSSEVREQARLPFALLILNGITGMIDAVSFLGLGHVFTANMTGNVVLLAFAVAGTAGLSAGRSAASLLAFLIGAVIGGRLGFAMATRHRRAWLLTAGCGEALLLFAAAIVAKGVPRESDVASGELYGVIVLTALAMGLRSATVRRLAVPELTTIVLTLTLSGVASESSLAGGSNPWLARRVAAVGSMFAGAALGALLLQHGLPVPLVLSATFALVVVAVYAVGGATEAASLPH